MGLLDGVKKVAGDVIGKGVDAVGKIAGAVTSGAEKANVVQNSQLPNTLANASDTGVNKLTKGEMIASLKDMIAKETNPKKKAELEALYAQLNEENNENTVSTATQPSSSCSSGSGCGGGSKTGGCNKTSGCNGTNSVGQNGQVDKQSAMEMLYLAEKNLQAAGSTQNNVSNPFLTNGNNTSNKEQAQQAYEQAKAIAQQAGVTDEEYAQFKQQKQIEEQQKNADF